MKIMSKLELIYAEVKRTNGRVTKLEDRDNKVENWQIKHDEYTKNKGKVIEKLASNVDGLMASDNKSKGASVVLYFLAGVVGSSAVVVIQYFLTR